ncbi:ABC transporter substrate-binding protein [Demequina capsici]|uniref:ABC transporter substrate-binding protein n=1 Tax=Demequina capsici TaxID=3075620 RepID=A0AA96F868_9MICO|nr:MULTISPECIES: ABC transporter substrate-binding protein [unclassified Demequina]WNM25039.1 ABC transporter substrate-binding protein [Demequina sp. OYTSA14]WNM27945.1 ABC transporter substrate-binding protein [Demequina sp. PMTSA13]
MSFSTTLRRASVVALAASTLALAGCSTSTDADSSASASPSGDATATSTALQTYTEGKLTIATGEPAYEPWVLNDDPASGEGFEAAVAYAVADQLGFAPEDVVWVRTTFDSAIAPGAKDWDLNIQQFSITDERKQAVDFSSPYYTATQAVVSVEGNKYADATTVADLDGAVVGVAVGTTSYDVAVAALGEGNVSVFNTQADVTAALTAGQIDAYVTDLPSALYQAAVELDGGVVVGQFADATGGDQFGFVLPKDSALTEPVTAAVDALTADGTLASLETEWLSDAIDVPVLN